MSSRNFYSGDASSRAASAQVTELTPAPTGFRSETRAPGHNVRGLARPTVISRGRLLLGAGLLYCAAGVTTFGIVQSQLTGSESPQTIAALPDTGSGDVTPPPEQEAAPTPEIVENTATVVVELDVAQATIRELEQELEQLQAGYETERARASSLQQATLTAEAWLQSNLREKTDMIARLMSVENRLEGILNQRDDAERSHNAWRWRAEILEERLETTEQNAHDAQKWFEQWVDTQVTSLSDIVGQTGMDVELAMTRARNVMIVGQGGPFELPADEFSVDPTAASPELNSAIQDMMSLRHFLTAAPLSTPFDHYSVTSSFGNRRDPVNGRRANHRGIDMVAPRNTKVMTTSPGTVLFAGRRGAFGNLVEIDHGLGITTRYAHLKSVLVETGDKVSFRDEIGVIGSSGRSTGRHLHYEILVDGQQIDPTGFIVAGRHLVHVFQNR